MSAQEFDLNLNTARLLMDEPFFAAISRRIDKRASYAIPTAGVMVNPDTAQFEMLYNPKFFAELVSYGSNSSIESSRMVIKMVSHVLLLLLPPTVILLEIYINKVANVLVANRPDFEKLYLIYTCTIF